MIGIVADDITGCTDIAIMYKKYGYKTIVFNTLPDTNFINADVIIFNTDSRFIDKEEAHERVYKATKKLIELNCTFFFNKTCSVFRGNIGCQFDAMLTALSEKNAFIVLGYPKNARTTLENLHYVNGILLENSQFRFDPMNPMTKSNLSDIIHEQSSLVVGSISWKDFDRGIEFTKAKTEQLKMIANYICFDVRDNDDLVRIYNIIKDEKVVCGAAQIAEVFASDGYKKEPVSFSPTNNGPSKTLIISGSVTIQTKNQIDNYTKEGSSIFIDPCSLINETERKKKIQSIITHCSHLFENTDSVLISYTGAGNNDEVALNKKTALASGISEFDFAKLLSTSLGEISTTVLHNLNINKIIILGGDTSHCFCECFGITHFEIINEIETGIPLSYCRDYDLYMVLKSGSFGSDDFINKAILSV